MTLFETMVDAACFRFQSKHGYRRKYLGTCCSLLIPPREREALQHVLHWTLDAPVYVGGMNNYYYKCQGLFQGFALFPLLVYLADEFVTRKALSHGVEDELLVRLVSLRHSAKVYAATKDERTDRWLTSTVCAGASRTAKKRKMSRSLDRCGEPALWRIVLFFV